MKRIYTFGDGHAEGNASMRNLLGGKGANLAEMNLLGMPVPPGFTITTEVCSEYTQYGKDEVVKRLSEDVKKAINHVEKLTGKEFNNPANPLLVSVRSGARASMPGMMDTVLNLGMNDATVESLAKMSGNPRFAWDSYRRFVQMYGDVVLGMKPKSKTDIDPFEAIMEEVKEAKGIKLDVELDVEDLKTLVVKFKAAVKDFTGNDFSAVGRHLRRIRQLDERARHHLPPHEPDPRRMGHRRQRTGNGLRQHGRQFGHRCRLQP